MDPRRVAGLFLIVGALRPISAATFSLASLVSSDWHGMDFSSLSLAAMIVAVVALIGIIGLATVVVGLRYMGGRRDRSAGLVVAVPGSLIAAAALSEQPAGAELVLWAAYAASLFLAVVALMLPARDALTDNPAA